MVAVVQTPKASRYQANGDPLYSGVVSVTTGRSLETGSLLFDGRWILTAAHGVENTSVENIRIGFNVNGNIVRITASDLIIHPQYDDGNNGQRVTVNDLALIRLAEPAPAVSQRYQLFRDENEVGRDGFLAGYGKPKDGFGMTYSETAPTLRKAQNTIDLLIGENSSGTGITSTVPFGSQFLVDFDNGSSSTDASGIFYGRQDLGLGVDEGIITAGDSGGPFFLQSNSSDIFQIAGIASYGLRVQDNRNSDTDSLLNSTFGEFAGYERAAFYQQFIDQVIFDNLPDIPQHRNEVKREVQEGDTGTTYAYFYLEFGQIVTDAFVSVAYSTFDGTATAGEDYIPSSGRVNIYFDERSTVIPIEIIGDLNVENNETFGLRIYDPIGGDLGGAEMLEAWRTIVNDDFA